MARFMKWVGTLVLVVAVLLVIVFLAYAMLRPLTLTVKDDVLGPVWESLFSGNYAGQNYSFAFAWNCALWLFLLFVACISFLMWHENSAKRKKARDISRTLRQMAKDKEKAEAS